jgi:excisionase family DNA binding protein
MKSDRERELVTIREACQWVGVSRRTIYNWINGGKVETIRTAGGCVRIYADTLFRDEPQPVAKECA